ncbi:MAG: cobalt-precorrin-5B (C(1))-methyltransferase [Methanolinea sp.]|nr:cobalt-precorrin-5B (C(1))-methyltransferase [Methanolinea sp.]
MGGRGALVDPVTGFAYPEEWVAACGDPGALELARAGLGVLTASGKVLRRGYTTGTTAAAACKAAILSLRGPVQRVPVRTPCGIEVVVPAEGHSGVGRVTKFVGDYPADATAGLVFVATAEERGDGVSLVPGEGIGRHSRDTHRARSGEPAISPPALSAIMEAIGEAMVTAGIPGVALTLEVPGGREAAARTLNPRLGIVGGISILGSTGLVEPWDDHLAESARERVASAGRVVVTTGRIGLRYARLHFPDREVVLAGSRLADVLAGAGEDVVLAGLPGLVLKFLYPGILEGTGCQTVEELSGRPEFRGRMERAFAIAREKYPTLRVVVFSREGEVLGDSG